MKEWIKILFETKRFKIIIQEIKLGLLSFNYKKNVMVRYKNVMFLYIVFLITFSFLHIYYTLILNFFSYTAKSKWLVYLYFTSCG